MGAEVTTHFTTSIEVGFSVTVGSGLETEVVTEVTLGDLCLTAVVIGKVDLVLEALVVVTTGPVFALVVSVVSTVVDVGTELSLAAKSTDCTCLVTVLGCGMAVTGLTGVVTDTVVCD